ncbi:IclR family transcriptional regulator (plasmid) [Haloterrigena salifodinae]|uniref:IclR family transcriptional regulator n=1 Tax=Haloterrigena salifodinae TaxID=2675099 RepID=A0A8T8E7F8_9EURY|nr:IclR family transcriptional regulator [Haloterrigena salifodinae]QRV17396.1 IclR family transcriptional regulator [Haloterrigena salifodinae]
MDKPELPTPVDQSETAKTTLTSFRVIEVLKDQESAGVSEIAHELDIAKGTAHKHLNTLSQVGYVVKEDRKYRLSLSFLGLGTSTRNYLPIYDAAKRPLERLADATGEIASVMIAERGHGIYVLRVSSDEQQSVDILEGERVPLHATAGGKAILAYLPEKEREYIIDRNGLPEITENTITDRSALADELQRIHGRRTAYDRSEFRSDSQCVASPITDQDGRAVAAVSVSGPAERMNEKSSTMDFASIIGSTASSIRNNVRSNRFYNSTDVNSSS